MLLAQIERFGIHLLQADSQHERIICVFPKFIKYRMVRDPCLLIVQKSAFILRKKIIIHASCFKIAVVCLLDSSIFELRCYLYLAKNLLASNKTGFSDPMARVLINNEMLETFPIYDTMSPLWDLTLIKTNITFHHKPEGVAANPPQIIVEFFDVNAPVRAS